MIIEELLTLPPWVTYQGIEFELQLINNGGNEIRLVYDINGVTDDSKHKSDIDKHNAFYNDTNTPTDPSFCGFLVLYEGITSDVDLIWAIRDCWFWLQKRGLLSDDPKKRYG